MIKLMDNCPTCGYKYVHEVDCPESMYVRPENTVDERAILLRAINNVDFVDDVYGFAEGIGGKTREQIVDAYLAARGIDAALEALANAEIKTGSDNLFLSGGLRIPK